ncbi:MAG TPA: S41 family peptidase [Gemmataceae bacterium]|jgi:carboxyl-terminal processing protease|nr:S41 family peptidase [Gemmataceae bacterium]
MSRFNLAWLITVPLLLIVGVSLSFTAPSRQRDTEYKMVRTVVDVLAEVDQHFVRPLDDEAKQKLVEDMINGGLDRLDPYSQYMNADEYRQFNAATEGNFGGIGIHMGIDPRTGLLMVISPMVGTPAHEAGILAGDLILKLDDKSTEGMRMNDAIRIIQGEPGTKISITVVHEGTRQTETVTVARAMIEVQTILGLNRRDDNPKEFEWFVDRPASIAYIRIVQFTEHTFDDLKKTVERLEKEGAKGLVIDLRDNPGGLLKSAVDVSDLFLTNGRIVSTKDRNGQGKSWDAKVDGTLLEPAAEHPIAVLINKNSASAAEIVSAALQDNKRAVIVGERSYGKGSVQKIIKLGGDPPTALKLTTDTYWRPNEQNMHRYPNSKDTDEWGVKPSPGFEITMKDDERLDYLRYKRAKDVVRKDKPKEADKPFVDRALVKAVDHLKSELAK